MAEPVETRMLSIDRLTSVPIVSYGITVLVRLLREIERLEDLLAEFWVLKSLRRGIGVFTIG